MTSYVRGFVAIEPAAVRVRDTVVTEDGTQLLITSVRPTAAGVAVAWIDDGCRVGDAVWGAEVRLGLVSADGLRIAEAVKAAYSAAEQVLA